MCDEEGMYEQDYDEYDTDNITISSVNNGYIVYDGRDQIVFEIEAKAIDEDEAEVKAMINLLHFIKSRFGVDGNRYSKHRIYIEDKPGDMHEDYTEEGEYKE